MLAIKHLIDFILHLDTHLFALVHEYGTLTYSLLFLIIFCETGLVILPFLPGDSLLFVSGSIAAQGPLNIWLLVAIMFIGAVIGDVVNYWIGSYIGPKVFESKRIMFMNKNHLQKAQDFYERKGPIVIVLARFIPIVRTFAPFVAGVSKMNFFKFFVYNAAGGGVWVLSMTFLGFFFGNIPLVKANFSLLTIAIILFSLIPVIKSIVQKQLKKRHS